MAISRNITQYMSAHCTLRVVAIAFTRHFQRQLANRLRVRNMSFTMAGRNLALWTRYGGVDPELNDLGTVESIVGGGIGTGRIESVDSWVLPLPRRYVFTMSIGF